MVECCCSREVRVKIVLCYASLSTFLHVSAAIVFGVKFHLYTVRITTYFYICLKHSIQFILLKTMLTVVGKILKVICRFINCWNASWQIAMWAAIGALYAASVATLHGLALRNQQRPNPHSIVIQLLPAILLVAVLGMIFSLGVTVYGLAKAISSKEGKLNVPEFIYKNIGNENRHLSLLPNTALGFVSLSN